MVAPILPSGPVSEAIAARHVIPILCVCAAGAGAVFMPPEALSVAAWPWPAGALGGRARQPAARRIPGSRIVADFDATRCLRHVNELAGKIGCRPLGSAGERAAARYIRRQLQDAGWRVHSQDNIRLSGTSLTTQNIIAEHPATADGWIVILGAHYDSCALRERSPGADDNGSGVAVLLELARVLRRAALPYQLRLVFFGGEERTRAQPEVHHVGSDYYVRRMDEAARSQVLAMVSVDMVGSGPELRTVRSGYGTDRARLWLLEAAERLNLTVATHGSQPWSDHEAFEAAGIPAVWLTRMADCGGHWHTVGDTPSRVGKQALTESGRLTVRFLLTVAEWLARPGGSPSPARAATVAGLADR